MIATMSSAGATISTSHNVKGRRHRGRARAADQRERGDVARIFEGRDSGHEQQADTWRRAYVVISEPASAGFGDQQTNSARRSIDGSRNIPADAALSYGSRFRTGHGSGLWFGRIVSPHGL